MISTTPGPEPVPAHHPRGLLRLDAAKVAADAKLDGKYLLRTSDPHLSTEDIALGYKQLLEVERGWRDMKQVLDLRPVYHRLEDRIRAHVLLCWLALLLARIVETRASTPDGQATTWPRARDKLQRLHVGTFTGPAGLSARPPRPPPRPAGCTPPSTCRCRPGSCDLDTERPQPADQPQHATPSNTPCHQARHPFAQLSPPIRALSTPHSCGTQEQGRRRARHCDHRRSGHQDRPGSCSAPRGPATARTAPR